MTTNLYSFWRSSAAFRVRIALNLKGISYDVIPIHLSKNSGEQVGEIYSSKNLNRLVPLLEEGDNRIHQSLAIIEYLEEIQPQPSLLPTLAIDRAWVRAIAMDIASDIHPINHLRVLRYLIKKLGVSNTAKNEWHAHCIKVGLDSLEKQLSAVPRAGTFAYGNQPGLIDACLVPQLFNALSAQVDIKPYPTLMKIFHESMQLSVFIQYLLGQPNGRCRPKPDSPTTGTVRE